MKARKPDEGQKARRRPESQMKAGKPEEGQKARRRPESQTRARKPEKGQNTSGEAQITCVLSSCQLSIWVVPDKYPEGKI